MKIPQGRYIIILKYQRGWYYNKKTNENLTTEYFC